MKLTIVQGGQTGADRGAAVGALEAIRAGWPGRLAGIAPLDFRDERGIIPQEILEHMSVCARPGLTARTRANVNSSHGLIIVSAGRRLSSPGSKMTFAYARKRTVPAIVVAGAHGIDGAMVGEFLAELEQTVAFKGDGLRLMIAGPRASKWDQAFANARELVLQITSL